MLKDTTWTYRSHLDHGLEEPICHLSKEAGGLGVVASRPADFLSERHQTLTGGAARVGQDYGLAFLDGLGQVFVAEDVAGIVEGATEKSLGDLCYTLIDHFALGARVDHVHEQGEPGAGVVLGDGFDQGVGVGNAGRFGRGDDEGVVCSLAEGENVTGDAGTGVDDDDVGFVFEDTHFLNESLPLELAEVGHLCQAGGAADESDTGGALSDDLFEAALLRDDVSKGRAALDGQDHVEVGQAQVGVDEDDVFAGGGEADGEVGGHIGFADAAFAARDGEDAGGFALSANHQT